ncbi:MAG: transcriptional regulator [Halothiobacillus sp. 24-54-40]|jgi:HTH-type transcriptional regulator/antitoxin HigA|nr:MAG: transcriptional regulator [Halothiobacillus sp. 35-54-62]OYZ86430.1 MAG: transcriptional regulator [Halothiobacillus sp. 24-54-40]OZA80321.1 MAG: transcriptional regulator [Halothiobacillus sp. 39-53-45]HQS03180.1 transcriptional regulator [Halothiobacillus sp.]
MEIRPIKTEADYEATLREIEGLMLAAAGSPEGDRLDVLVTLVEAYERNHYPMDFPDPVEAIKFRMEQQGLTVEDLVPIIGRKNRVYEILARKRPLTLRMIEGLHETFAIPAESLLKHSYGAAQQR